MKGDSFTISRQLLNSDEWTSEPFTRAQAWIDLIGLARWKSGNARLKGHRIELERGQLCWSEVKLAERWQWSRGKVRRYLSELEIDQRIVQQKSSITTVISLVNYNEYQMGGTANGTADGHRIVQRTDSGRTADGTADSTADGTRKKTDKTDKKENKDNNDKTEGSSSVESSLYLDWEFSDVREQLSKFEKFAKGRIDGDLSLLVICFGLSTQSDFAKTILSRLCDRGDRYVDRPANYVKQALRLQCQERGINQNHAEKCILDRMRSLKR